MTKGMFVYLSKYEDKRLILKSKTKFEKSVYFIYEYHI